MLKIFAGVLAALVIAAGGYFGVEFYLQQRMASDIEAAFANVRASGAKASHGKIAFDVWNRTITVADIAGEFTAQPPVSVKIGRIVASGVSQQDAGRFAAGRIDAADVEVAGTFGQQAGLQFTYRVPLIEIADYAGPGGPLRPLDGTAAAAIYRFALDHFAMVSAKSVVAPAVTVKFSSTGSPAPAGTGAYSYSGVALRDIKDGKIAATTIEKMVLAANMGVAGKLEKITGEIAGFTTSASSRKRPLSL